jgi:hypothetical protein
VSEPTPTDLLGEWTLMRRVADLRAHRFGAVRGTLRLQRDGDHIEWAENGILLWEGARIPVSRGYRLRREHDGWWVLFADGRAFHPWRPGEWVVHPCRADRYRGLINIDDAGRWRVLWDVRGPGKAQRILTRLTRDPRWRDRTDG